jgi:peptidyl-prolyl cis-trans isomerase C
MPYVVNGDIVPEELIHQELGRLRGDPQWQRIRDEADRARRLRAASEYSAIDRTLVAQAAARDARPIDPALIEQEVLRHKAAGNRGGARDDSMVRRWIEGSLRLQRTTREMTEGAPRATADEVRSFYDSHRENFRNPELFQAAHIVKHVNEQQSEEQARAGIAAALAELDRGNPFAEVAERHSDCKGSGGDLGQFPAGTMVDDFENALRALEPGQRTGIFRTPFGFHIAELRAKTAAGPASFEEVRQDIERVLTIQHEHQTYLSAVGQLRSRAEIRFIPATQASAAS